MVELVGMSLSESDSARIKAVLRPGESVAEFLAVALETELVCRGLQLANDVRWAEPDRRSQVVDQASVNHGEGPSPAPGASCSVHRKN